MYDMHKIGMRERTNLFGSRHFDGESKSQAVNPSSSLRYAEPILVGDERLQLIFELSDSIHFCETISKNIPLNIINLSQKDKIESSFSLKSRSKTTIFLIE